jgi:hypothetical protein
MTRSKLVQQHLDTPFEGMFIEAFAALWGAPQSPYATSTEAKRADLLAWLATHDEELPAVSVTPRFGLFAGEADHA